MSQNERIYKTIKFIKAKHGQSYLKPDLPDYVNGLNEFNDIPCGFSLLDNNPEREKPVYEARLLFNGILLKRESRISKKVAALELILEIADRIDEAAASDEKKED